MEADLIFGELERVLAEVGRADIPALIGRLEAAKSIAWRRLIEREREVSDERAFEPRLLTLAEAAALLGTSENYVEVLARQRKIRTVRLPGLDRGGRPRAGKQVRIRAEDLHDLIGRWTDEGIDGHTYVTYSDAHDRGRGAPDSETTGTYPAATRRAARRGGKLGGSMGAWRDGDEVDSGKAPPAVGGRGEG